jgi:hypothetical protein
LQDKIPYAPDSATFYLKVYFSQNRLANWHFDYGRGSSHQFNSLEMSSIGAARENLRKLEGDEYRVIGAMGAANSANARGKKREVEDLIRDCIYRNDQGESVNITRDLN